MKGLSPFVLESTALEPGLTLIEASAGTGKTFTIAGLVLRLLLEEKIPLDQILAVTYTTAATRELRERVRSRLRDALEELRANRPRDPVLQAFLQTGQCAQGMRLLDAALQNFDQAQIFTIHGFCQRVLRQNAFESGVLFEMELLTDPAPLFEEVAHDFWRRSFYQASPMLPRLALAAGRSPQSWTDLLGRIRNHPGLRILPAKSTASCAARLTRLEQLFQNAGSQWQRDGPSILKLLSADKNLSRDKAKSHFAPANLAALAHQLTAIFAGSDAAPAEYLNALQAFSTGEVERCCKPGKTAPVHPFFILCQQFSDLTVALFHQLDGEFLEFSHAELPRRKQRLDVLTYDDLLVRLRDGLDAPNGRRFRKAIAGKYRAALIDEFQDTDPVQEEIFRRLFAGPEHFLFFIGDPKQAIYGFRGADVFTYLRAAKSASRAFTLSTNWRSEKPLLDAINSLFGAVANPFLVREIAYRPVEPPAGPREGFKRLNESAGALRFRFLETASARGPLETLIGRAVVTDIIKCRGLNLGGRPLEYSDMAVLVRSNRQAARFQELLRSHGIKSVLQTDASVFDSVQAAETLRLLQAVLEPGRDLNAGLATGLVGLSAAEILGFDSNDTHWQHWLEKFRDYRNRWQCSGFISMFRFILVDLKVRERLVQWPGGERRLTNLLHLAELLHDAESGLRLTPEALCTWLRQQRNRPEATRDGHQLRLESDEEAVLIATIHKSKGLEYPVVFCPFLWKAAPPGRGILFHDPAARNRLTLDLRSTGEVPDHAQLTAREQRAEALRVFYVAVTRAQNRCFIYTGDMKGVADSPLGYLLGDGGSSAAIEALVKNSRGTISLTPIDSAASGPAARAESPPAQSLQARHFPGSIPPAQMITSFSGLITGAPAEETDLDDWVPAPVEALSGGARSPLAEFPRGARAGIFLHDVLQHLDFQTPAAIEALVREKLLAHGLNADLHSLCGHLRHLLQTPLAPPGYPRPVFEAPGLCLQRLCPHDRLTEVEFAHPFHPLQPRQLQQLFEAHGSGGSGGSGGRGEIPAEFPASLGRLDFKPMEGYLRGYIDLLFDFEGRYYLVDWKSNWLGERLEDYSAAAINACMIEHRYFLQYHLYTVATDRFLRQRVPGYTYDTHFGGVLYLFLRGIDPENPHRGIFRDRPAAALVSALGQLLAGASA